MPKTLKHIVRHVIVWILTQEAKVILKKYHPKIILVTGSVGKTSAKDAVYTALSSAFFIRKSEKSFNSDIGVPLTVIGVGSGWMNPIQWLRNILDGASLIFSSVPYPKYLVVEVGADRPGDISKSLSWLKPDMVVATRFPDVPVHVEFYQSPEAVSEEETAPVSWLSKEGIYVANADDPRAATLVSEGKRILFGFGKDAEVRASRFHTLSRNRMPLGISFEVSYQKQRALEEESADAVVPRAQVSIFGILGKAHAYAVLAGIAAAVGKGISLSIAARAFAAHTPQSGRMRLIPGIKGSLLIDDSYNASPVAVEEALASLKEVPHRGRRFAVLADMLELGSFSVSEHRRMGALAAKSCDVLITTGIRARGIADAARENGMPAESLYECENSAGVVAYLSPLIQEGDVILIKGSQSMRMEYAVKELMAEPEKAGEKLVRQDKEWQRK